MTDNDKICYNIVQEEMYYYLKICNLQLFVMSYHDWTNNSLLCNVLCIVINIIMIFCLCVSKHYSSLLLLSYIVRNLEYKIIYTGTYPFK